MVLAPLQTIDYSRLPETHDLPNLIQLLRDSYQWFLEVGLRELFHELSPIEDFTGNRMELYFKDYRYLPPDKTPHECRQRNLDYAGELRVTVGLLSKKTSERKEQELFFGNLPHMTETGTFIINGAERVVVSQLVRSPGVYFGASTDPATGRPLCTAKLIPNRGAWLEFETSNRDLLTVKVDRKRKIAVTTLLRALDNAELAGFEEGGSRGRGAPKIDPRLGTDERILQMLEGADDDGAMHQFVETTLAKESPGTQPEERNKEWAMHELYKKLRPGDPPTTESALGLLEGQFFNPRRYDLGSVGRYKVDKRMREMDSALTERAKALRLDPERRGADEARRRALWLRDLLAVIHTQIAVNNERELPDDIDHLGNRRIRAVGEQLQSQFRVGMTRMERVIRERMTIIDPDQAASSALVNIRPVQAAIKEFFGGHQLSQFMDQTNPLAELTHKRRLSALGPGGLSRDRAGFDVRDVHYSHYGRICPIETPEGPNIGLIGSLATFGVLNEHGFIKTPYRKVISHLPPDHPDLIGRELSEDLEDAEGETIAEAGDTVSAELARRIAAVNDAPVAIRPYVSDEIEELTADDEREKVVAQANTPIDANGYFVGERVEARIGEHFDEVHPDEVGYMDVSPRQIVSVAASLIPFLEHDDANRALMGANMQRQAVPLVRPEVPLVGTGMERPAAFDSGQVLVAEGDGEIIAVTAEAITVRYDGRRGKVSYPLIKFLRSNQGTCINQRAIVSRGDRVAAGQPIADSSSTDHGELALGQNVLAAFMAWEGYNFEDAVIVSERLVQNDKFTSIHMSKHDIGARQTKLGDEEITRDIPNVAEESLSHLDADGMVRIGAEVEPGDILVGKITPKGETELTAEEKLLRAIFGEKAREVKDTSLRVPHGVHGTVIDARIFTRDPKIEARDTTMKREMRDASGRYLGDVKALRTSEGDRTGRVRLIDWIGTDQMIEGLQVVLPQGAQGYHARLDELVRARTAELHTATQTSLRAKADDEQALTNDLRNILQRKMDDLLRDLEDLTGVTIIDESDASSGSLPTGMEMQVRVTIAERRKLQVGDKMAGRHGNKGVISTILPVEDMPHLEDGTPVDVVLSPIGVPTRMNLGQILETQLGWAANTLGFRAITPVFDGAGDEALQDALARAWLVRAAQADRSPDSPDSAAQNGAAGNGAANGGGGDSRTIAWLRERGYGEETVLQIFDDAHPGAASRAALAEWLISLGEPRSARGYATQTLYDKAAQIVREQRGSPPIFGKQTLVDGRSGLPFDQPVTVGYMYMLKLTHMVEDKIHARSTGPYSLITQQPLGGKAQFGGQRFGEMEVWALEAYGAANILQELLTVKSDDVVGRVKAYEAIVKGETVLEPGVPESFRVLLKELQSLGLAVDVINQAEERVEFEAPGRDELPQLGVNLSGFEGEEVIRA